MRDLELDTTKFRNYIRVRVRLVMGFRELFTPHCGWYTPY